MADVTGTDKGTTPHAYPNHPLHQLVSDYIRGGGRRVLFWDTHHGSPIPREVFGDPSLRQVVKDNGLKLTYAVEEGSGNMAQIARLYAKGTDEQRHAINEALHGMASIYYPANPDRYAAATRQVLDALRKDPSVRVLYPDPRKVSSFHTSSGSFLHYMQSTMRAEPQCLLESTAYIEALPPKTRETLESEIARFEKQAFTGLDEGIIDEHIAATVQKDARKQGDGHVQFVLYGAGHYSKNMDLDERLGGLSIGVVSHPHLGRWFVADKALPQSFPDYSWNPETQVLEKLDNDAAKARFLGFTPEEYAAVKKDPATLAPLPPAEAEACRTIFRELAISHPRVRGEEEVVVTPPPTPAVPTSQQPSQPGIGQ